MKSTLSSSNAEPNTVGQSQCAPLVTHVVLECGSDWVETRLTLDHLLLHASGVLHIHLYASHGRASIAARLKGLQDRDVRLANSSMCEVSPGQAVDLWMSDHFQSDQGSGLVLYLRSGALITTEQFDLVLEELAGRHEKTDVFQFLSYGLHKHDWSRLAWCDESSNKRSVYLETRNSESVANCMEGPVLGLRRTVLEKLRDSRTSEKRQARQTGQKCMCTHFAMPYSKYLHRNGQPLTVMQRQELQCLDARVIGLPESSRLGLQERVGRIRQWMGKRSDTVLLICDQPGWAFEAIAKAVIGYCQEKMDIKIIYAAEMINADATAARLLFPDGAIPRAIHGFWRVKLFSLLEAAEFHAEVANHLKVSTDDVVDILAAINLSTGVPDYLRLESDSLSFDLPRFHMLDRFSVSNVQLEQLYSRLPMIPQVHELVHDVSDVPPENSVLSVLENKSEGQSCTVAWIGNSAWGKGSGLDDHKGYRRVVKPLLEYFEKDEDVNFVVFDKSANQQTHENVMAALMGVDVLLCASVSEGSPLPVLEAMSSGCSVICTDVGIVSEILTGRQREFIVPRDADSFIKALLVLKNKVALRKRLQRENIAQATRFNLNAKRNWLRYLRQLHGHNDIERKALKHFLIESRRSHAATNGSSEQSTMPDESTRYFFKSLLESDPNWVQVNSRHSLYRTSIVSDAPEAGDARPRCTLKSILIQGTASGLIESLEIFPQLESLRLTAEELLYSPGSLAAEGEDSCIQLIENVGIMEFEELVDRFDPSASLVFVYSSNGIYSAINEAYRSIEQGETQSGYIEEGRFTVNSEHLIRTALWHERCHLGIKSALRSQNIPFLGIDAFQFRHHTHGMFQQISDYWGGELALPGSASVSGLYDRHGARSLKNRAEIMVDIAAHPACQTWIDALR